MEKYYEKELKKQELRLELTLDGVYLKIENLLADFEKTYNETKAFSTVVAFREELSKLIAVVDELEADIRHTRERLCEARQDAAEKEELAC